MATPRRLSHAKFNADFFGIWKFYFLSENLKSAAPPLRDPSSDSLLSTKKAKSISVTRRTLIRIDEALQLTGHGKP